MALGRIDLLNPLNDRHPLATGLGAFWLPLPNMTGGTRLFDLCNRRSDGTLTGGPTRTAGENGFGAVYCSGGPRVDYTPPFSLGSGDFTSILRFRPRTWPTGGSGYIGVHDNGSNSLRCFFNSSGGMLYLQVGGSGALDWSASVTLAAGQWWTLGLRRSGTTVTAWRDGVQLNSGTQSGTTGSTVGVLGQNSGNQNPNADFAAHLLWPTALPDAAMIGLHDQCRRGFPDLLRRLPARTPYEYATGGGGTAVPVFLHHYRMMGAA